MTSPLIFGAVFWFYFLCESSSLPLETRSHSFDVKTVPLGANLINNPSNITKCTAEELSKIEGYLLDLDGNVYNPIALLPGAAEFFDWLYATNTSYILLSNGFKGKEGISKKLSKNPFKLNQKIPTSRVHTAGIAAAKFLSETVPPNANLYIIATTVTFPDGGAEFLTDVLKKEVPKNLFDTWNLRTDMTLDEIHEWAYLSRQRQHPTFVVFCPMGEPKDMYGYDPITHKSGYLTLDFGLISKVTVLLRNNAYFVVGAPDVAESRPKSKAYPGIDASWATIGSFEKMFLTAAEMFEGTPREKTYHFNTGKGGNLGHKYMVEPALEALRRERPNIGLDQVMIVGDNFGTDIKVGNDAGIKSMLVLSGIHQLTDAPNWSSRPDCYLHGVGEIVQMMEG